MLELGQSQTPGTGAGDLIKDGTEASFMADVIEGSRETPVIVRFLGDMVRSVQDAGPDAGGCRDGRQRARSA